MGCPLLAGGVSVVASWDGLPGASGIFSCSSPSSLGRGGGAEPPPFGLDEVVASAVRLADVCEGI